MAHILSRFTLIESELREPNRYVGRVRRIELIFLFR